MDSSTTDATEGSIITNVPVSKAVLRISNPFEWRGHTAVVQEGRLYQSGTRSRQDFHLLLCRGVVPGRMNGIAIPTEEKPRRFVGFFQKRHHEAIRSKLDAPTVQVEVPQRTSESGRQAQFQIGAKDPLVGARNSLCA